MTMRQVVIGVDPGIRDTGLAVVAYEPRVDAPGLSVEPRLLHTLTVHNPGTDLIRPPRSYLRDVNAAILDAIRLEVTPGTLPRPILAVEGVKRPSWRVGGKVKPLDPSAIMGTSIVLGAILGRTWPADVVILPPAGNGHALPLNRYPDPLATDGLGHDKRRHERSAYDLAISATRARRFANENGYLLT